MFSCDKFGAAPNGSRKETSNMSKKNLSSKELINKEALVNFVALYAFEYIGHENGKETTLSDELAAVAKMVMRADVCRIAVDPYRHSRLAYAMAELSESEKLAQVKNNYRRAGKKLFWLNSMCRVLTGECFIVKLIDPSSMDDIEYLVDEFEAIIRYAAMK